MSKIVVLLALALTLGWTGCSEEDSVPTAPGVGSVRIHLTDAPSDYLSSAQISVTHAYLIPTEADTAAGDTLEAANSEPEANRIDIYGPTEEPMIFDLLELRDGIEGFLAQVTVSEGTFHQLRLVVEDATVTLMDGYTFSDSTKTKMLKTPSAHSSGIKVRLNEPVEIQDGHTTLVVVDFDVDENFKFQGNPETPAGIHGVLFTPSLKEMRRETLEGAS